MGNSASGPDHRDRTQLPLDVDTDARPIGPVTAVGGAPNVVIVLIDDMGFGASTAYGGPCEMPTAERLAEEGLRYSRFHVTSLCSPTRQALLTGRNHHSVGMGVTSEMSTPQPGYHGYRPASAATIAQILGGNGYCTSAFGKWHQTPPVEVSPSGPFTRWPMGEGFDFFYGFMGAEMNHWYPQLYQGRHPVEPTRLPEDGYHLTEDLVDHAIDWVENQQAITPDRPFFTYLALGATHAPFHVAPQWRDKYAGRFDAGWDAQREETLARQKELGIVPESAELAPWAEGVPHWDELDETEKRVAARFMETYAGFAEHADVQVGRFVDSLDDLGVLDDTLFFYLLGDNGASGEGGPRGTFREHLVGHGIQDDTADMAARLDELGDRDDVPDLPGGLGAGDEHAVPVDQAGRLAPRRHPRRDDRALGQRDRRAGRDPAPVAPRDRRPPDHLGGRGAAGADHVRRGGAAADRGHQPALHLRRGRARRTAGPRSTSRWSATAASTTTAGLR